jgi:uroporphyrin-III C-methyltransferase/precorrin-2 dehydrogenase/sirohydrochlorin ferrochelatase
MQYLPMFAELRGRPCLVVGGGMVAQRRVGFLRRCRAEVTVLSPELTEQLRTLADAGEITFIDKRFEDDALDRFWLVIAATNDHSVNAAVAGAAETAMRFCNVVDSPELCSFVMPAIIDREPVTVAISSSGDSPVLARWVKAGIEALLPVRIGEFASFLRSRRAEVKARIPDFEQRRRFWETVIEGHTAEHAYAGRAQARDDYFQMQLEAAVEHEHLEGEAWIVGAGPGDAGLLTLRGRQLLSRADVILYDRLVDPHVLEFARREAEFISVGKAAGQKSTPQEDINTLLVRLVREGKRVCRLKGGDPMVFARLADELKALQEAGLHYQIVPGVSAIAGCAAYAGIPLTWREVSQSLLMTTGHARLGGDVDLGANPGQRTVALYMAAARHAATATQLIELGHAPETPVAIIENGTLPNQRITRTTLQQLADPGTSIEIGSPALLIVGNVVGEARELEWFQPQMAPSDSPSEAGLV